MAVLPGEHVDGLVVDLDEAPALDKNKKHTIEAVIDRVRLRDDLQQRLAESFETALALARRWGLPEANVLLRRHQGHFTLDLGVTADPGPLLALARLLKSL